MSGRFYVKESKTALMGFSIKTALPWPWED